MFCTENPQVFGKRIACAVLTNEDVYMLAYGYSKFNSTIGSAPIVLWRQSTPHCCVIIEDHVTSIVIVRAQPQTRYFSAEKICMLCVTP